MLDTQEFGNFLYEMGLRDFVGVPCSYLSPLINYAINENRFIMSNNEGDAVAIASGISLGSPQTYGVVLMQNSGLSNALSPLTSLNYTFKIPILGFVSLRGERDERGKNTDEPQHELLGVITDKLLEICEIHYMVLESSMQKAKIQLLKALEVLSEGKSVFFIVKDKTFNQVALKQGDEIPPYLSDSIFAQSAHISHKGEKPTRLQALNILWPLAFKFQALLLATTGKCGRELYEINDSCNQLYMVGSMGCVSSLCLGIALKTRQKVIAIDGDSALLMRLGALSTNAYYTRDRNNFCHILLDNESHDSTGGQFNLSPYVDFASIARSCGYAHVYEAQDLMQFESYVQSFLDSREKVGAWFIALKISKGSKANLGRPKITPQEVATRLQSYISAWKEDEENS